MHFSSLLDVIPAPCVNHPDFITLTPHYTIKFINNKAPSSNNAYPLVPNPVSSSAPYLQKPSMYVPPLRQKTTFHTHTK
jgi:hypothetical protein